MGGRLSARRAICAAVLLALMSCGAPEPRVESFSAVPQAQVIPAAFSDNDPHDWPGRRPSAYPVHGIDVSRWQGDVDWRAARAGGANFAWLKATEGGDHVDPAFRDHWRGAARAGVPRGAYHHFYFCRPAAEQARWFIRNVPRDPAALPPVLDIEWTPFSRTCRIRPEPEAIRREALVFLRALERHYGKRPLIYTTVDFYRDTGIGRLPYEFWLRSTAAHPSESYPGQRWTFWQYTSTGAVAGIGRDTDINAFAGSPQAWAEWLAARTGR